MARAYALYQIKKIMKSLFKRHKKPNAVAPEPGTAANTALASGSRTKDRPQRTSQPNTAGGTPASYSQSSLSQPSAPQLPPLKDTGRPLSGPSSEQHEHDPSPVSAMSQQSPATSTDPRSSIQPSQPTQGGTGTATTQERRASEAPEVVVSANGSTDVVAQARPENIRGSDPSVVATQPQPVSILIPAVPMMSAPHNRPIESGEAHQDPVESSQRTTPLDERRPEDQLSPAADMRATSGPLQDFFVEPPAK